LRGVTLAGLLCTILLFPPVQVTHGAIRHHGITRHYLNGPHGWTRTTQYTYGTITASGHHVYFGEVAADPSIPFGAHMVLPGLGTFTVWDRGGAVYGAHVDVYVPYYPYPAVPDWVQGAYWTR